MQQTDTRTHTPIQSVEIRIRLSGAISTSVQYFSQFPCALRSFSVRILMIAVQKADGVLHMRNANEAINFLCFFSVSKNILKLELEFILITRHSLAQ